MEKFLNKPKAHRGSTKSPLISPKSNSPDKSAKAGAESEIERNHDQKRVCVSRNCHKTIRDVQVTDPAL